MSSTAAPTRKPVTLHRLREMHAQGEKITMLTAYDATFARLVDAAGVDSILVGDSLGMTVQGHTSTVPVSLDDMVYHTRCVARGNRAAWVLGDLPFGSYQEGREQALRSSVALMQAGAHMVKLEGGGWTAETVHFLTERGVPVCAHLGLTPQSVHAMGGFRVQGRRPEAAQRIVDDAKAVEDAGAYCLVLEGIPGELAARITAEVSIPTIGIGAGVHCDGQVLVCYDLLGLTADLRPRFVKRYDELFDRSVSAVAQFCDEVRERRFPAPEHTFGSRRPRPLPSTG